ncbi:FAD:protein FMN transferase [Breznakia pachnodae]|uniref:FAD:protein FMN transferase n=1 Tax=Breznakia pachnodae TaxID=265178 RepID=A0ABU0E2Z8_9FIRM|nr:FAD:protein FMN transferase [Breznakia pachnodae]MDQ0361073.1 thiamine biosynthesis lipoprotein [Breznakia pachnodae]
MDSYKLVISALGTENELHIWGEDAKTIVYCLEEKIHELEAMFSYYKEESDIGRINRNTSKEYINVSDEVFEVIRKAVATYEECPCFNVLMRPMLNLWYENQNNLSFYQKMKIKKLIDMNGIETKAPNYIRLGLHQQLDLGGIAKGYIADRLMDEAKRLGAWKAIINLGGDIGLIDTNNNLFTVGIRNPFDKEEVLLSLSLSNKAISTSGIYERYNPNLGIDAHHIVDTRKVAPVSNNLMSVSVIANTVMDADIYATIFLILGIKQSMTFIKKHHLEVIFITKDHEVIATSTLEKKITETKIAIHFI